MTRVLSLLLLITLSCTSFRVAAQVATKNKKAKKVFVPPVFLGNSALWQGTISKPVFDSLLKQGIQSHDSLGNAYTIAGFDFTYAERNLYEDSMANLVVLTDFKSEYCTGDSMTTDIVNGSEDDPGIYERTKAGDTAYFFHIKVFAQPGNKLFSANDTLPMLGRGMKFVLTK